MNRETYTKITKLQDLAIEQSNILADIIEQLNDLASVYEKAAEELKK